MRERENMKFGGREMGGSRRRFGKVKDIIIIYNF